MMNILAKSSGESLSEHTIECIKAALVIIKYLPLCDDVKNRIKKDAILALALHDSGKAAEGFQKVLRKEKKSWEGKRHESLSASLASSLKEIPDATVFSIMTHHRDIFADSVSESRKTLNRENVPTLYTKNFPVRKEMEREWLKNKLQFLEEWRNIEKFLADNSLPTVDIHDMKFSDLSIDDRWFERSGKFSQTQMSFNERYYFAMLRGIVIASDHLGSSREYEHDFPDIARMPMMKHKPRHFQKMLGNIKGSAILVAPTGSGKTEAALLWFQSNYRNYGRLFYVLPYTASINAMHKRFKKIFGEDVGILHHKNLDALYSMSSNEEISRLDRQENAKKLKKLTREIWFPIRICTPHQILRYSLRGKGWENMLSEFQNACFIFDEVHAYDPRVLGLILGSAKMFKKLGARFLFITATFPEFLKNLITESIGDVRYLEPDPNNETDAEILDKKRHNIIFREGNLSENIVMVAESIKHRSSTLIVCNHVKTAQEIYSAIKGKFPRESVVLLHSQFNQEDRNNIETEIIKSAPKVLIATQVIEVSLDMDFEQAFLEPAPIDALVQRMGRVNRYGLRPPADINIFTGQMNRFNLYCKCNGNEHEEKCRVNITINELKKINNPVSERDLVELADIVYGGGYFGEDKTLFDEGFNHPDIIEFEKRMIAGAHREWVDDLIEKTDGTIDVLPSCLKKLYEKRKEENLWLEAHSLLVPIRIKKLFAFKGMFERVNEVIVLDLPYSKSEGLKMSKEKTDFSEQFI